VQRAEGEGVEECKIYDTGVIIDIAKRRLALKAPYISITRAARNLPACIQPV